MRDFRDAKVMAQTLRESLSAKAFTISHSESLELVSKMFGAADWNTLSAVIQDGRRAPAATMPRPDSSRTYPAIPIRDLVPFPAATYPIFVGREKTIHALDHAFRRQREVVLAVQKQSGVDEPGIDDVYEVGVLAGILDMAPLADGTVKVLTQAYRRVEILRLFGDSAGYLAEIADIIEGPIPDAPELIRSAVERFKTYAKARGSNAAQVWPLLDHVRDPGRLADAVAPHLHLTISDRQSLLATRDPVARLERVHALMQASPYLGVSALATLSTGDVSEGPKSHQLALKRLGRVNKALARKRRGSHNFGKTGTRL
jgi:ATP-dependent Lon protease